MAIYIIMFSDFQHCLSITVNSPTCMISFDRIILNHLDGWPTPHLRETFQHSMPADGSSRMNGRLLVMILLHWMFSDPGCENPEKIRQWDVCQLKKVDDSLELQHHNIGKRMERLVLQGGKFAKAKRIQNFSQPRTFPSTYSAGIQGLSRDVLSLPWSGKKHVVCKSWKLYTKPWAKYAQLWPNWTLVMSHAWSINVLCPVANGDRSSSEMLLDQGLAEVDRFSG